MVEGVAIAPVSSLARDGVPILIDVAVGVPSLQHKFYRLVNQRLPDRIVGIVPKSEIDQEVGRWL